jgi:hypothetical protein
MMVSPPAASSATNAPGDGTLKPRIMKIVRLAKRQNGLIGSLLQDSRD